MIYETGYEYIEKYNVKGYDFAKIVKVEEKFVLVIVAFEEFVLYQQEIYTTPELEHEAFMQLQIAASECRKAIDRFIAEEETRDKVVNMLKQNRLY